MEDVVTMALFVDIPKEVILNIYILKQKSLRIS